jgi:hypothetical protein
MSTPLEVPSDRRDQPVQGTDHWGQIAPSYQEGAPLPRRERFAGPYIHFDKSIYGSSDLLQRVSSPDMPERHSRFEDRNLLRGMHLKTWNAGGFSSETLFDEQGKIRGNRTTLPDGSVIESSPDDKDAGFRQFRLGDGSLLKRGYSPDGKQLTIHIEKDNGLFTEGIVGANGQLMETRSLDLIGNKFKLTVERADGSVSVTETDKHGSWQATQASPRHNETETTFNPDGSVASTRVRRTTENGFTETLVSGNKPLRPPIEVNTDGWKDADLRGLYDQVIKLPPARLKELAEKGHTFVFTKDPYNKQLSPSEGNIYVYRDDGYTDIRAVFRHQKAADNFDEETYKGGKLTMTKVRKPLPNGWKQWSYNENRDPILYREETTDETGK